MGASGTGIRDDDVVCDIVGVYAECLKSRVELADARRQVLETFAEALQDPDDARLVWIGLAESQWTFGAVDPDVLARVEQDVNSGADAARWQTVSEKAVADRKLVLTEFVAKIRAPNPRPRRPPRTVLRPPPFSEGDCLSVTLSNGQFAAAFVTVADVSDPEFGRNVVGVLDWLGAVPPDLEVFRTRRWLRVRHHSWNWTDVSWYSVSGFRAAKSRIRVVGNLPVEESDLRESPRSSGWERLGEQVLDQRAWDRAHPVGADLIDGWIVCRTCGDKWRPSAGDAPYFCSKCAKWVRVG